MYDKSVEVVSYDTNEDQAYSEEFDHKAKLKGEIEARSYILENMSIREESILAVEVWTCVFYFIEIFS